MGELEKDYWRELDKQCVEAEAVLEEQQKWLEHDTPVDAQDELNELSNWIESLPLDEQETAIAGLKWYEKHFMDDEDLVQGWERHILDDGKDEFRRRGV